MPVGNLRTAANNDQDDDPRALRPIPIATKDVVSFFEKNNPPGQNAEVVRRLLMFSLFFPVFLCFFLWLPSIFLPKINKSSPWPIVTGFLLYCWVYATP